MRYNTVFLMGMLLALVLSITALAFSFPFPTDVAVPKTSSMIVVDALLNFTSEWNGSAVLVWYNPLSEVELDRVYILHNDSHYFFGAVLYDPDNVVDDYLTFLVNASGKLYKYPSIAVDSNGYPWIGYSKENVSAFPALEQYPMVTKSARNDGIWETDTGFPYLLNSDSGSIWYVSVIPLSDGKVYVAYSSSAYKQIYGRLWTGTAFSLQETISSVDVSSPMFFSGVGVGDTTHIVYSSIENTIIHAVRTETGWTTEAIEYSASDTSVVLTYNPATSNLLCFWHNNSHYYYKLYNSTTSSWGSRVDWIDESSEGTLSPYPLTVSYQAYEGNIIVTYVTGTSPPFNLKFANFTVVSYAVNNPPTALPFYPYNGSTLIVNSTVTFKWNFTDPDNDLQEAFCLQLDKNRSFISPLLTSDVITSLFNNYTCKLDLLPGKYYWRVKVWDNRGLNSSWSIVYHIYVNYGGVFNINKTSLINPVENKYFVVNKRHGINVTVWSPWHANNVTRIILRIGDIEFLYNISSNSVSVSRPDLVKNIEVQYYNSNGWGKAVLYFEPTWEFGGTYNLSIYSNDTKHNLVDEKLLTNYIRIINTTYLLKYELSKTSYLPNEEGKLYLTIAFTDTLEPAVEETIRINGNEYTTDANGKVTYTFTTPSRPGTYSISIDLAHGESYTISYQVVSPPTEAPAEIPYYIILLLILLILISMYFTVRTTSKSISPRPRRYLKLRS